MNLLLAFVLGATQAFAGGTVRIATGAQDTTINCAADGPVVRELKKSGNPRKSSALITTPA